MLSCVYVYVHLYKLQIHVNYDFCFYQQISTYVYGTCTASLIVPILQLLANEDFPYRQFKIRYATKPLHA